MREVPSLKCRKIVSVKSLEEVGVIDSTISVLQYNILADAAIPRGDAGVNITGAYKYCPDDHRYMDSRHNKIMAEVKGVDADIVAFQEVEAEHFLRHLKPDFDKIGYDSVQHLRYTDHIGLAIFYKRDNFSLLSETSFILHDRVQHFLRRIGVEENVILELSNYMKMMSTYPDIIESAGCLMANLHHKASGNPIAVGNIHITWKEFKYPVLQMLQAACGIEELAKFADGAPCIFAGDFNSCPDMPLYQMISSGGVCELTESLLSLDSYYVDGDASFGGRSVIDMLKDFKFNIKLRSVYHAVMGTEPEFTSWDEFIKDEDQQGLYKGCLDYIWYSQGSDVTSDGCSLLPCSVLDVPEEHVIAKHVGLPSVIFPSDHLPIYAVFEIK